MKTPNEKPDIFNEFFREESSGLLEGDQPPAKGASLEEKMKEARVKLPFRVKSESVDEEIIKEKWAEAGKFFSRGTKPKNAIGIKGLYPLSLYHLTVQGQQEKTSASYPLWINNGNLENKDKYGECLPVASLLRKIIEEVAPPDQEKRFLSAWMNNLSLQLSADPETPEKGLSKLREHLGNIPEKFNLRGKEKESITGHLSTITSMLPVSGTILPYVKDPWLQILQSAITHHASQYRKNLKDKVAELSKKLNDILLVEADKAPAKSSPDSLKSSMELAGDLLDFEKLSGVLPKSSSVEMPASRLKRIQKVLTVLSAAGQFFAKTATLVTALPDLKSSGLSLLSEMDIVNPDKSGIFETAANIFEKTVSSYRDLIVAVKIGELEVQNKFDEARHEPYFENFDWKLLSDEELSGCPPVVAITEYHEIIHKGINSLLEVLTHHYPIKTLVLHQGPVFNEGMDTRHEIGAMAVAMRETFAMQGTIADARGLYRGFMEGLSAPIPALFYILNQQGDSDAGPEYWSQLALESRAFPGFVYSGNLRDDWGRRFGIDNNLQPGTNWPAYELDILDEDEKIVRHAGNCTYADFAALNKEEQDYFMVLPEKYASEDLFEVGDYLLLEAEERISKLPFLWMIDDKGALHRAVVSWQVIARCLERLDFWHYLQDSAGINSYHVNRALQEQQERLEKEYNKKIEQIKEEHQKILARAKEESAGEAMEKLTSFLLNMDVGELTLSPPGTPSAPLDKKEAVPDTSSPAAGDTAVKAEPKQEEEEDLPVGEPWIETPLCTTCNECTDINKSMFKYNADKLAYIANPKAGTFAQLVQAAEKCPAGIIHPGKPLNPDEPGLEDLIRAAAKYNT